MVFWDGGVAACAIGFFLVVLSIASGCSSPVSVPWEFWNYTSREIAVHYECTVTDGTQVLFSAQGNITLPARFSGPNRTISSRTTVSFAAFEGDYHFFVRLDNGTTSSYKYRMGGVGDDATVMASLSDHGVAWAIAL